MLGGSKLDSISVWLISVFLAVIFFGAGYIVLSRLGQRPKLDIDSVSYDQKSESAQPRDKSDNVNVLNEVDAEAMSKKWGYDGEFAPDSWYKLDPSYHLCGSGANQSPVDLSQKKIRL